MIRTILGGASKALQQQVAVLASAVATSSTDPAVQHALQQSVATAQATAQTAQQAATQALANTATLADTVAALNKLSNDYVAAVKVSQDDRTAIRAALEALTTRVTALEARKLTLTSGAYTSPPLTLLSGATQTITVTFATPMPDTTYAVTANLIGGSALLGATRITGILSKTTTGITAQVAITGLSSLLGATYTVEAIAARNG